MFYEFGIVPAPPIEKEYKTIFNPKFARHLLRLGNVIVDIKPHRDNPSRTLFVFEVTDKFNRDFLALLENAE